MGDIVEVSENGVIERIMPRKNQLIRPFISNIDQMIVVFSSSPKADLLLVDKMLIEMLKMGINVILAVNKKDINPSDFFEDILFQYKGAASDIIEFSASSKQGLEALSEKLKGKFSCFAGQSAVGKTSILNELSGMILPTGELSEKIERGKHTTRHSEIYPLGGDTFVADTPGFSDFELDIPPRELFSYYPDFLPFENSCKYKGCTHTAEPCCGVREAVQSGKLSEKRLERYLELFRLLTEKKQHQYN